MKIKRLNESIPLSYDKRRLNNLERIRQESEARKIYNASKRERELGVREWNPKLEDRISNVSYDKAKYELFNAPVGTIIQISNHNLGDYIGEYTRIKGGWVGSQKYRSNRTKPASVDTPDGFAMQVVGDDVKVIAIGNIDESLNESTSSNQFVDKLKNAFHDVFESLSNLSEIFNAFEENGFEDCNNYICDNYPFDCDFEIDLPDKILDWEYTILENMGVHNDDDDYDGNKDVKIYASDYDTHFEDFGGVFGESGAILSLGEIKEYWNENKDSDPSFSYFNSFDEWWADTRKLLEAKDEIIVLAEQCDIADFFTDSAFNSFVFNIEDIIKHKRGIKKFIHDYPEEYLLIREIGDDTDIGDYPDGYEYILAPRGWVDFDDDGVELVDITKAIEEYENKR